MGTKYVHFITKLDEIGSYAPKKRITYKGIKRRKNKPKIRNLDSFDAPSYAKIQKETQNETPYETPSKKGQ